VVRNQLQKLLGAAETKALIPVDAKVISDQKALMTLSQKLTQQMAEGQVVRGDLMVASGQVGFNKPYRAPIYLSYRECIQGLYK
jgi:hypothetical protein